MSRRTLSTGALAVLFGVSLGCTDAAKTLLIVQNQVPGEGCTVSSTATTSFYPKGVIDVASPTGYILTPLVQSLADSPGMTDVTRIAFIEGYNVDLSVAGEGTIGGDTSFSSLASAAVFPGGSTALTIEVLPKDILDSISFGTGSTVTVVAEVSLFGKIDGGDIESTTFSYPIDVCDGCLLVDAGMCTELATDFSARTGGYCNAYQDLPTDCCTASDSSQVCPAEKEIVTP